MSSQIEPRIQLPKAPNKHVRPFVTPRDFAGAVCSRFHGRLGCQQHDPTTQAEDRTSVPDRDHRAPKKQLRKRPETVAQTSPKYSDDSSYRIRQNLQIWSERLHSMLRKVDRTLTG